MLVPCVHGWTLHITLLHDMQVESFFNFFIPPPIPEDDIDEDEMQELQELLEADYELGCVLRRQLGLGAHSGAGFGRTACDMGIKGDVGMVSVVLKRRSQEVAHAAS